MAITDLDWQNSFEAILTDRTVLSDTYIKMSPVPSTSKGRLVIEDNSATNYEIVRFTSKDANGVFVAARNEDGNSTGIHAKGVRVRMNITAQDLKDIRDYANTVISAYSALPAGSLVPYAGTTAPASYLLCDGAAVSRTTYAGLFAVIGTAYGIGDGTTTFNVPNLKGRTIFGRDAGQTEFDVLGETGGQKTVGAHTHNINDPGHAHTWNVSGSNSDVVTNSRATEWSDPVDVVGYSTTTNTTGISIQNTGSGMSGANNLNPYVVANYIIKT